MGGRKKAESSPGNYNTRRGEACVCMRRILRRGEDFRPRKWPVAHASLGLASTCFAIHVLIARLRPFSSSGITLGLRASLLW